MLWGKEALWLLICLSWVMVSPQVRRKGIALPYFFFFIWEFRVIHFGINEEKEALDVAGVFIWLSLHCDPRDQIRDILVSGSVESFQKGLKFLATYFSLQQPLEIPSKACNEKKGSSKIYWFQYVLNWFLCRCSHIPVLVQGIYWLSSEAWRI